MPTPKLSMSSPGGVARSAALLGLAMMASPLSARAQAAPAALAECAAQLAWTTAPLIGPLRGYVKLFSGYGETLIDYNWNQTTFGIGATLNDWL